MKNNLSEIIILLIEIINLYKMYINKLFINETSENIYNWNYTQFGTVGVSTDYFKNGDNNTLPEFNYNNNYEPLIDETVVFVPKYWNEILIDVCYCSSNNYWYFYLSNGDYFRTQKEDDGINPEYFVGIENINTSEPKGICENRTKSSALQNNPSLKMYNWGLWKGNNNIISVVFHTSTKTTLEYWLIFSSDGNVWRMNYGSTSGYILYNNFGYYSNGWLGKIEDGWYDTWRSSYNTPLMITIDENNLTSSYPYNPNICITSEDLLKKILRYLPKGCYYEINSPSSINGVCYSIIYNSDGSYPDYNYIKITIGDIEYPLTYNGVLSFDLLEINKYIGIYNTLKTECGLKSVTYRDINENFYYYMIDGSVYISQLYSDECTLWNGISNPVWIISTDYPLTLDVLETNINYFKNNKEFYYSYPDITAVTYSNNQMYFYYSISSRNAWIGWLSKSGNLKSMLMKNQNSIGMLSINNCIFDSNAIYNYDINPNFDPWGNNIITTEIINNDIYYWNLYPSPTESIQSSFGNLILKTPIEISEDITNYINVAGTNSSTLICIATSNFQDNSGYEYVFGYSGLWSRLYPSTDIHDIMNGNISIKAKGSIDDTGTKSRALSSKLIVAVYDFTAKDLYWKFFKKNGSFYAGKKLDTITLQYNLEENNSNLWGNLNMNGGFLSVMYNFASISNSSSYLETYTKSTDAIQNYNLIFIDKNGNFWDCFGENIFDPNAMTWKLLVYRDDMLYTITNSVIFTNLNKISTTSNPLEPYMENLVTIGSKYKILKPKVNQHYIIFMYNDGTYDYIIAETTFVNIETTFDRKIKNY